MDYLFSFLYSTAHDWKDRFSAMTIDKLPPPTKQTLASKLAQLQEPDDSFVVSETELKSLRTAASRLKIPLITQREHGGVRVWRKFSPVEMVKMIEEEGAAIAEAQEWRFTSEPTSWTNGEPYRRQTTDGKDRRTVRVDPDSPDTILEIL